MNITVKKASIKSGIFLSYSYQVIIDDVTNTNNTSSDAPIHNDLRNAFTNLIPFFAHICEEINDIELVTDAINNPELHLIKKEDEDDEEKEYPFLKYLVNGFTIGGKGDTEGVTLSGNKRLDSGDIVNFNTPFMRFDSDYIFSSDLYSAVEILKKEVFDYMQGKQAPRSQAFGLFDNDESEEETHEEDFD